MPTLAVIHLVRAKNGPETLRRFLASYDRFPGGIDHDLWIVFKGFKRSAELAESQAMLKKYPHRSLFVRDIGYDMRPYYVAAQRTGSTYNCFLNSFSVLKDEFWLRKLHHGISQKGVGMVAATGSYESHYSNVLAQPPDGSRNSLLRRSVRQIRLPIYRTLFDPFPNEHLRLNAFILAGNCLATIRLPPMRCKFDGHRFESGKDGVARKIQSMNLRMLVVGKDGTLYETQEWSRSSTFRQGNQENLLVADKQTEAFNTADDDTRRALTRATWGEEAL